MGGPMISRRARWLVPVLACGIAMSVPFIAGAQSDVDVEGAGHERLVPSAIEALPEPAARRLATRIRLRRRRRRR